MGCGGLLAKGSVDTFEPSGAWQRFPGTGCGSLGTLQRICQVTDVTACHSRRARAKEPAP